MNPCNTELGWQDVPSIYWFVSTGLVHTLISSTFEPESFAFVQCGIQECEFLG